MKFYHATTLENMNGILKDKIIHKGIEGCVYLTTNPCKAYYYEDDIYNITGLSTYDLNDLESGAQ